MLTKVAPTVNRKLWVVDTGMLAFFCDCDPDDCELIEGPGICPKCKQAYVAEDFKFRPGELQMILI